MKHQQLISLTDSIARDYHYRRRHGLFWFSGARLTRLLQLQKSRWGNGVYVNFGVTPNAMVVKSVPPGAGYWGLSMRAPEWEGPHSKQFLDCEVDHDDRMSAGNMKRPIKWLFQQMEIYLADEDWVREVVLDIDCIEHSHATLMMKEWAMDKMRSPNAYFQGTPYYRRDTSKRG